MKTMRAAPTLIAILSPLALLAACGDGEVVREEGGAAEAEGEVLGGTISDDMLPLDSLRSQSPPLRSDPTVAGDVPVDEQAAEGEAGTPDGAPAPQEEAPGPPEPEPAG